jgi:tRNA pseudouridine38-40 synthase
MRAFRIAYDGRPYRGFQRQPDVATVEGELFDALRALSVLADDAGKPPGYAAAGRTDAGVSAVAQTVAFGAPDWLVPAALNGELSEGVRAWAYTDAPAGFHATHDAARREYTYHLHAPPAGVADRRAREALDRLAGEHDFRNQTPDDGGTVRDREFDLARDGDVLRLALRADGFARQLVRRTVSLVAAVATGEVPESRVERVLSDEPLSGPEGVAPASAAGLVLTGVAYPALDFRVDPDAAASARDVFEERHAERATVARVAGAIRDEIG